jgi:hypothetical protein
MKKTALFLMILIVSFGAFSNTIMATEKPPIHTPLNKNEIPAELKPIIDRFNEIKDMDKSSLNRDEKKELRKELRTIKKNLRGSGNGIYISSGAIIIILLLIIIF